MCQYDFFQWPLSTDDNDDTETSGAKMGSRLHASGDSVPVAPAAHLFYY